MSIFQDTYHRALRNSRKVAIGTAVVVTGAVIAATPWTPGSATANLWIDTNGGTCTLSTGGTTYSDAAACSSFQAALNAAGSGGGARTVKVRAGTYGGQTISDDSRASGDRVTFSEDNGDASFDYFDIHGDNITLSGFTTLRPYRTIDYAEGVSIAGGATTSYGVQLVNVLAQGGVYLSNSNGVTITGGEICCTMATASHDQKVLSTNSASPYVTNTTIDGVSVHDARRDAAGVHSECGFLMSVQTFTIRNSRFYNCTVYNVSLGRIGSYSDPNNVTFENNTFEPTDDLTVGGEGGFYSFSLGHVTARFGNLVFRNNSFGSPIQFFGAAGEDTPNGAYSQTTFVSNILKPTAFSPCNSPSQSTNPTYSYNVSSASCGGTDTVVANPLANYTTTTGTWNFALVAGAAAIGAGSPTNSTATDILGTARSTPDAGAYEYGG